MGVGGMIPHFKVCILAAVQTSYLGPQICRGFKSVAEPSRRPVFQWCQLWGTRRMASYPPHAVLEMPALSPTMSQVTSSLSKTEVPLWIEFSSIPLSLPISLVVSVLQFFCQSRLQQGVSVLQFFCQSCLQAEIARAEIQLRPVFGPQ